VTLSGAQGPARHSPADLVARRLEAAYGPVERLGGGFHSRVFAQRGADGGIARVLKVYREANGLHILEAEHMRRAGQDEWLLGTRDIDGLQVLELRYFHGVSLCGVDVRRAVPGLKAFLHRLHHVPATGRIDVPAVVGRAERFHGALADRSLDPLLEAVRSFAASGLLDVPSHLCHLDLWCANILLADDGEVLVLDWGRSAMDDPARDIAILKTGTLDELSPEESEEVALSLAVSEEVAGRLPAYVALQTLNDLDWYRRHEPHHLATAKDRKLPRALSLLARPV
jgi:hypothetical protein